MSFLRASRPKPAEETSSSRPAAPLVREVLTTPGEPLDAGVAAGAGKRLQHDFSAVRVHADERAAESARAVGAMAYTAGPHVVFAAGQYRPGTPEGQRLLDHELIHVAQGAGARGPAGLVVGAPATAAEREAETHDAGAPLQAALPAALARQQAPTTMTALPEADRKRIQVVTTTPINVTNLDDKFATKGTTLTLALPAATTVVLDPSVPAGLSHGIQNVAAALTTTADVTPAPVPPNSTATVNLDLAKFGGINGAYRFTFDAPPPARGAAPARTIVVEQLGTLAPPAGTKAPVPPPPGTAAAPDPIADKITKHGFSVPYTGAELEALRAAISQIPDSQLSIVDGLTFLRAGVHPTKPTEAGHYDPKAHAITLYDLAFKAAQNVHAQGGTGSSGATQAIVHEIGHAIDLAPLRAADLTRQGADKAVAALPTQFPNPDDPTGFRWNNPQEKAKIDAVLKAQRDAEKALTSASSRSGTKTVEKPGKVFEDVIGTGVRGIGYREAASRDGLAVSSYGATDWQESYAEAYSLYVTSPDTLKALRPNTYAYLASHLP